MGFSRDKTRKDWIYQFYHRGQLYSARGFRTRREASAAREERRKNVRTHLKTPKIGTTFYEVATVYLDYCEKRFAKKTYQYKKMVYKGFIKMIADRPMNEITPLDIQTYLNTRPSAHNWNVHKKELSALWSYAIDKLRLPLSNPCKEWPNMPVDRRPKQIPTQEEVLRLIAACGPSDRALIMVLVHTLARVDEILRLTWEDVNFTAETVRLWTRKNRTGALEFDEIPMNPDLKKVLWGLWEKRQQEHWVFFNEKTRTRFNRRPKFMKGLCKRAGIRPYGFHAIRHFMASYMVDTLKVGKKTISTILRHKSLATTEIYLHSIGEAKAEAMGRLEGFGIDFGIESDQKQAKKSIPGGNTPLEIINKTG